MTKIKRVLLLVPRYEKSRYRPVLNAGIGYVAEALNKAGIDYKYLDMGFFDSQNKLQTLLKGYRPDLVGISMLTFRYKNHYELARHIKEISPDSMIAVGGAHSSLFGAKVLEGCSSIDIVFKGEGEGAFVDLCRGKGPQQIRGLVYREGNVLKDTGGPEAINVLDSLNFPTYQGFPLDDYIDKEFNILPIISSRGCPYKCSYCPVHQSMGRDFRMRSPKSIAQEIEYWHKRGYYRFSISDDNFTFDRMRVVKICEEINKRNLRGLKLSCDNGVRADRVDYDLLKLMKDSGFWRIAYGIEAGNDRVLSYIDKGLNLAVAEKAIKDACELGFTVRLFFLIGSPTETWKDFEDSLRLAKKYPVFDASFYNLIPYPGTELFGWIDKNGIFLDKPDNYLHYATGKINVPVFYTRDLSFNERKRAFDYSKKVSLSIARKALKRKLKPFGLMGSIAAHFYGLNFVNMLLDWPVSRKIIIRFSRKLIDMVLEEAPVSLHMERPVEYYAFSKAPRVSVIIPSLDGYRGGNVLKLVEDLKAQSYKDFEVNIIKNVSPQGKAINLGADKSKGEIFLILDDDSRVDNPHVIKNLVNVLDRDERIGMAGAPILVPPDANWLQKKAGEEFPRFGMKVVNRVTESDMACHGCCAIRREVFEEVGRERENILRGLDPDLRYRMRQKGYNTVLVPETWVYHPLPGSFAKLMKTFFRNGMGSAYCAKFQPGLVYDTDEIQEMKSFRARVPFIVRIFRFPIRIFRALIELKLLRFISYLVYAVGFYYGILRYSFKNIGTVPSKGMQTEDGDSPCK
ncbi:MAG: radical SAM protein [Candidatus Omnitrophica bacterium]|nr:radical SAM protein [Candidatus Omnitrophota bacterium]MBU1869065.1 radical SAM protein [Candidatus Omnitrophota bacterium]